MTEEQRQEAQTALVERGNRRDVYVFALLGLLLVVVAWVAVDRWQSANREEAAKANAASLAEQVHDTCENEGEAAEALGSVCDRAEDISESPEVVSGEPGADGQDGEDGQDGAPGPAPSVAQVQAGVRAVLAQNPGLVGEPLNTAVAAWLTANPPSPGEPGRAATGAEILVAVQTVCADAACVGEPGEDGQDAPPVTDEQVQAQVAAYCDARGECRGEPGSAGQPPLSWVWTAGDRMYTCRRDDPFDLAAPRYTCTAPEPTPTPEPTPDPTIGHP